MNEMGLVTVGRLVPTKGADRAIAIARRVGMPLTIVGDVTPYLLAAVSRETGGKTLETNVELLEANAGLAARMEARKGSAACKPAARIVGDGMSRCMAGAGSCAARTRATTTRDASASDLVM